MAWSTGRRTSPRRGLRCLDAATYRSLQRRGAPRWRLPYLQCRISSRASQCHELLPLPWFCSREHDPQSAPLSPMDLDRAERYMWRAVRRRFRRQASRCERARRRCCLGGPRWPMHHCCRTPPLLSAPPLVAQLKSSTQSIVPLGHHDAGIGTTNCWPEDAATAAGWDKIKPHEVELLAPLRDEQDNEDNMDISDEDFL